MSLRLPAALAAAVSAIALLGLTPTAGAATLQRAADGVLVYNGGPASTGLNLQAGYDGTLAVFYGSSPDVVTAYPADCTAQYDASVITCAKPPGVRVDMGDGDDNAQISTDVAFPVTLTGGNGKDLLEGNGATDTLDGGPGDDKLTGSGGGDVLAGGDGDDELQGGAGRDRLDGGAGNDLLHPDGFEEPSADVVDGGPGVDSVEDDYSSRFANGRSPWRSPSPGAPTTGARARTTTCAGSSGSPCPPAAGSGNDTIDVRDGEVDSVTCGAGTDRVLADAADVVAPDCEQVERSGGSSAAGGRTTAGANGSTATARLLSGSRPRLRAALARGVTLRLAGLSGTRVTLTARAGRSVVATATGRVSPGSAAVRLRFTASARRRLSGRRSALRLVVSGRGVRTSTLTLKP